MTHIAVLGMGRMGRAVARRLCESGATVTVWNRTPGRTDTLVAAGARTRPTPAEAASGADLVITMLADRAALASVITGPDGVRDGIDPHALLVEMSTVGPAAVEWLAGRLPATVRLVDAPVMGSVHAVAAGGLTLLAGGEPAPVAEVAERLAALGRVRHCGPSGTGAAMKLVANNAMLTTLTALAETLALADVLGLSEEAVTDLLADGPLAGALRRSVATEADFPIRLAAKDVALGLAVVNQPVTAAVRDRLVSIGADEADVARIVPRIRAAVTTP
ncbi:3-hydroxyisobutyrate dehydrogenase [Stackebrandtia albiflava]|uniref:3-hydroxyisobutyrate dehydrogenase n=1 Tax=Stackebrandtia albiflava TaxID=406432 RepID=A0A562UQH1_9ACTN|nr:NAD(P)-dependent oxidoreductase [Stackebrandtia albiflava]TWJ07872.1 3-hydroxyisobutyrate dehydrogenase [Stackebrandtia albiflava]